MGHQTLMYYRFTSLGSIASMLLWLYLETSVVVNTDHLVKHLHLGAWKGRGWPRYQVQRSAKDSYADKNWEDVVVVVQHAIQIG